MARGRRRKCKCCRRLFVPDPRNLRHQCYCSQPPCRAASKAASQARWLAEPKNQDYFQGPVHLARGQAWRARHPGYWRKASRPPAALKDVSMAQVFGSKGKTGDFVRSPLQDLLTAQPAVLIGLIAHLVGDTATRGHRPHHRPFVTPRPRHSRHVRAAGPSAALTAEAVVIDYETFAKIHDCRDRQGLTATQIARALGLNRKTVAKWLARPRFAPQQRCQPRSSILDPFSSDCSMHISTALSRSSSACARRDTAAASPSCATTSAASGPQSCPSISRASALRSTGVAGAPSPLAIPAAASPSSSWCSPTAGKCSSSSQSRRPWSIS